MFVIFLKFAENRHLAGAHLAGHNDWIRQGIDDAVFLLVGSVAGGHGAIIAHGVTRADLEQRLDADPFVAQRIVAPEIIEIQPAVTGHRLAFVRP
ncbi:MAG TPA: hypothetical protein VFV73_36010 [Streptosporangiaceae bacterium]|nr:hypothetical protein [Streptosporangiaceae bacterium]